MFNRDEKGNPSPGAPFPKYGDEQRKKVCSVCFELINNRGFRDKYWTDLKEADRQRGLRNKKLKSDGDFV